jgi:hypothetical protein
MLNISPLHVKGNFNLNSPSHPSCNIIICGFLKKIHGLFEGPYHPTWVVSYWPLTVETQDWPQVSTYRIYLWYMRWHWVTFYSQEFSFSSVGTILPMLHTHISFSYQWQHVILVTDNTSPLYSTHYIYTKNILSNFFIHASVLMDQRYMVL